MLKLIYSTQLLLFLLPFSFFSTLHGQKLNSEMVDFSFYKDTVSIVEALYLQVKFENNTGKALVMHHDPLEQVCFFARKEGEEKWHEMTSSTCGRVWSDYDSNPNVSISPGYRDSIWYTENLRDFDSLARASKSECNDFPPIEYEQVYIVKMVWSAYRQRERKPRVRVKIGEDIEKEARLVVRAVHPKEELEVLKLFFGHTDMFPTHIPSIIIHEGTRVNYETLSRVSRRIISESPDSYFAPYAAYARVVSMLRVREAGCTCRFRSRQLSELHPKEVEEALRLLRDARPRAKNPYLLRSIESLLSAFENEFERK